MDARMRSTMLGLLVMAPALGAAQQDPPCGECYDRVSPEEPRSIYDQLPGGDDPREPLRWDELPRQLGDGFLIGATVANLRSRALVDSRASDPSSWPPCINATFGPVTERIGETEWQVTACGDAQRLRELRFAPADPNTPPESATYARVQLVFANGSYRLAENPFLLLMRNGGRDREALQDILELWPDELAALEQRLRDAR